MTRLRARDLEALLTFLEDAQAVEGPAPFTPELLDRLADVVGCDFATFQDADRATRTVIDYVPCSADAGRDPGPDDEWWACGRTIELWQHKSSDGPHEVVLSHIFSRRQRTHADFNPNFRDWGVADEIHVDLDPTRHWSVELCVARTRDFGRREHVILQLLRPHLAAIYRSGELRRAAAGVRRFQWDATKRLTERERDVMTCIAEGLTDAEIAAVLVVERSTVRKHLEHVYDKLAVGSRTAALAKLRA